MVLKLSCEENLVVFYQVNLETNDKVGFSFVASEIGQTKERSGPKDHFFSSICNKLSFFTL